MPRRSTNSDLSRLGAWHALTGDADATLLGSSERIGDSPEKRNLAEVIRARVANLVGEDIGGMP